MFGVVDVAEEVSAECKILKLLFNFFSSQVSHRVVFPLELRLFNTSDDAVNPDRMYDLVAVVIHCGSGPNR